MLEQVYIQQQILGKNAIVVLRTIGDSPASKAGLLTGDIITKVDGNKVKDYAYLRYELYQHQAGDTIEITYLRNGKEHTTKVTLGSN